LPAPEITDQLPLPMDGLMALKVADVLHRVWLTPASAPGGRSLVMVTAAVAVGQLPLSTVHKKILLPGFSEVTCDEALLTELMLPPPESADHVPVPEPGAIAERVAEAAQMVWLLPAFADGGSSRTIVRPAVADGQLPLLTVHTKELLPGASDVTVVELLPAEAMLAPPDSTDQLPEPMPGSNAVKLAAGAHNV